MKLGKEALSKEENVKLYLDFYSKIFEDMARSRSDCIYEFEGLPQAKIVVSGLISAANKKVNIFCNNFSANLWMDPRVFTSISKALDRDVSFNIWAEGHVPDFFEKYLMQHKTYIQYYPKTILDSRNFITSDSHAYAIIHPGGIEGHAMFNDPVTNLRLKREIE